MYSLYNHALNQPAHIYYIGNNEYNVVMLILHDVQYEFTSIYLCDFCYAIKPL